MTQRIQLSTIRSMRVVARPLGVPLIRIPDLFATVLVSGIPDRYLLSLSGAERARAVQAASIAREHLMIQRLAVKSLIPLAAVLLISGCATSADREGFAATDHFEDTNRFFHANNLRLDRNVLRPVAQGYDYVTPELVRHMIGNGLNHLDLTQDFANHLMQGNIQASLHTFGRFTLNTIVGAGGLLDPATEFGLPRESTDFGITLGKFGVGEGSYLVLPLLGPTTVRDAGGFVVDKAFDPMTYLGQVTTADGIGPLVTALEIVDKRNRNADLIDDVLYESVDSYVTLRSGYLQRRRAKIKGGQSDPEALPDIFDDETPTQ